MLEFIKQPWPWYIAGPLIGLMVPALLIIGNKTLGISSSLRHVCAICIPSKIPFFHYDWKKELWNLFFVGGVIIGGLLVGLFLMSNSPAALNPKLLGELQTYGIAEQSNLLPVEIFSWSNLFTLKGLFFIVFGGFLIGFGTRYAGGCTSGHAIMGLSNLQLPSLIATICFMVGGFIMANFILPLVLNS